MIREFNVVAKLQVASYENDLEVRKFAERLVTLLEIHCEKESNFIVRDNILVSVNYESGTV